MKWGVKKSNIVFNKLCLYIKWSWNLSRISHVLFQKWLQESDSKLDYFGQNSKIVKMSSARMPCDGDKWIDRHSNNNNNLLSHSHWLMMRSKCCVGIFYKDEHADGITSGLTISIEGWRLKGPQFKTYQCHGL